MNGRIVFQPQDLMKWGTPRPATRWELVEALLAIDGVDFGKAWLQQIERKRNPNRHIPLDEVKAMVYASLGIETDKKGNRKD